MTIHILLWLKNIDERLYPASLTKIVTAMVTLENVKDVSVKTKMSQAAYDASVGTGAQVAGITVGEELSVDTLCILLWFIQLAMRVRFG